VGKKEAPRSRSSQALQLVVAGAAAAPADDQQTPSSSSSSPSSSGRIGQETRGSLTTLTTTKTQSCSLEFCPLFLPLGKVAPDHGRHKSGAPISKI